MSKGSRVFLLLATFQVCLTIPSRITTKNMFKTSSNCECGYGISSRIVNGEEAAANAYPWMVAIFYNGKMHCGGSLINDRYILTAGHCVVGMDKNNFTVFLGLHNFSLIERDSSQGNKATVEKLIFHENFASDYLHDTNDIGLIKVKPIKFTNIVNPVCLPKPGLEYKKGNVTVMGWGRMSQGGNISKTLRKTTVSLMSNNVCRNITAVGEHILPTMLCAYKPDTDACQGDSGGPLVFNTKDGIPEQIGIVSWGIGCARPNIPGVYTRLTEFLDWIAVHTKDAVYCAEPEL